MSDGQKISFSFSKVKKPTLVKKTNFEPKEKKEYVDCFDGTKGTFSYKGNVKNEPLGKQELVIPLVSTKTSIEILRSRIEERSGSKNSKNTETNGTDVNAVNKSNDSKESKNLEEQAALEILKDLKNSSEEEKDLNKMVIKADGSTAEISEADIDYDNIPVSDFGMAMLRGMGWKPNAGIGKEPKLVPTVSPKLRPKGLGLGAKPAPEASEDKAKTK